MVTKGKTGNIHGVEVKARVGAQTPTVKVNAGSVEGRRAIIKAAKTVYDQHQAVIQALANR